jgi:LysR family transcriptional activator of nhaA
VNELDLVLSDAPIDPAIKVRAYSHVLGECGVTFFGVAALAKAYQHKFPQSLTGAPILLPTDQSILRRSLDRWFTDEEIYPVVVGEFEDSALLKVFGQTAKGVFVAPSVIEKEVKGQYGVQVIGRVESIRERFYAISVERRIKHPAVVAIAEAAQQKLFG